MKVRTVEKLDVEKIGFIFFIKYIRWWIGGGRGKKYMIRRLVLKKLYFFSYF